MNNDAVNKREEAENARWYAVFECLSDYIEECRKEETKNMISEQEKHAWVWDSNVPPRYKTNSGSLLWAWIATQRRLKRIGNLKVNRKDLLMSIGLIWEPRLTGERNAWEDQMEALKVYVSEQTWEGHEWDGDVPENYKCGGLIDEDGKEKHLGKWIFQQRKIYKSGKLKKDREAVRRDVPL